MAGMTRRAFVGAAAAAPFVLGANDRIRVGVIGVGNRSNLLIDQLPDGAEIVAVADCFLERCEQAEAKRNAKWKKYQDYRQLLDQKDVDAVIVGTTDHGRVLPSIHACMAGKDVYAEKPLTLYISEGRALVQAARAHKTVFQVGSQQRSMAMDQIACAFVRDGGLGKLKLVQGVNYSSSKPYTGTETQPVPESLNWDMWVNQTPMRPYNKDLQFGWMQWDTYSGGEMTNWGAHGLDIIQWACGMSLSGPVELYPLKDGPEGAIGFKYPNGVEVRLDQPQGGDLMGGGIFIGEKGKIQIWRNNFKTEPAHMIKELPPPEEVQKWRDEVALWQAKFHMENWLDCVRTRKTPIADVEIGQRSISVAHLCNITRKLNRTLSWVPEKERFVEDAEANALLTRQRRAGYELPAQV
jgi:predicted dehydrogenase